MPREISYFFKFIPDKVDRLDLFSLESNSLLIKNHKLNQRIVNICTRSIVTLENKPVFFLPNSDFYTWETVVTLDWAAMKIRKLLEMVFNIRTQTDPNHANLIFRLLLLTYINFIMTSEKGEEKVSFAKDFQYHSLKMRFAEEMKLLSEMDEILSPLTISIEEGTEEIIYSFNVSEDFFKFIPGVIAEIHDKYETLVRIWYEKKRFDALSQVANDPEKYTSPNIEDVAALARKIYFETDMNELAFTILIGFFNQHNRIKPDFLINKVSAAAKMLKSLIDEQNEILEGMFIVSENDQCLSSDSDDAASLDELDLSALDEEEVQHASTSQAKPKSIGEPLAFEAKNLISMEEGILSLFTAAQLTEGTPTETARFLSFLNRLRKSREDNLSLDILECAQKMEEKREEKRALNNEVRILFGIKSFTPKKVDLAIGKKLLDKKRITPIAYRFLSMLCQKRGDDHAKDLVFINDAIETLFRNKIAWRHLKEQLEDRYSKERIVFNSQFMAAQSLENRSESERLKQVSQKLECFEPKTAKLAGFIEALNLMSEGRRLLEETFEERKKQTRACCDEIGNILNALATQLGTIPQLYRSSHEEKKQCLTHFDEEIRSKKIRLDSFTLEEEGVIDSDDDEIEDTHFTLLEKETTQLLRDHQKADQLRNEVLELQNKMDNTHRELAADYQKESAQLEKLESAASRFFKERILQEEWGNNMKELPETTTSLVDFVTLSAKVKDRISELKVKLDEAKQTLTSCHAQLEEDLNNRTTPLPNEFITPKNVLCEEFRALSIGDERPEEQVENLVECHKTLVKLTAELAAIQRSALEMQGIIKEFQVLNYVLNQLSDSVFLLKQINPDIEPEGLTDFISSLAIFHDSSNRTASGLQSLLLEMGKWISTLRNLLEKTRLSVREDYESLQMELSDRPTLSKKYQQETQALQYILNTPIPQTIGSREEAQQLLTCHEQLEQFKKIWQQLMRKWLAVDMLDRVCHDRLKDQLWTEYEAAKKIFDDLIPLVSLNLTLHGKTVIDAQNEFNQISKDSLTEEHLTALQAWIPVLEKDALENLQKQYKENKKIVTQRIAEVQRLTKKQDSNEEIENEFSIFKETFPILEDTYQRAIDLLSNNQYQVAAELLKLHTALRELNRKRDEEFNKKSSLRDAFAQAIKNGIEKYQESIKLHAGCSGGKGIRHHHGKTGLERTTELYAKVSKAGSFIELCGLLADFCHHPKARNHAHSFPPFLYEEISKNREVLKALEQFAKKDPSLKIDFLVGDYHERTRESQELRAKAFTFFKSLQPLGQASGSLSPN